MCERNRGVDWYTQLLSGERIKWKRMAHFLIKRHLWGACLPLPFSESECFDPLNFGAAKGPRCPVPSHPVAPSLDPSRRRSDGTGRSTGSPSGSESPPRSEQRRSCAGESDGVAAKTADASFVHVGPLQWAIWAVKGTWLVYAAIMLQLGA